MIPIHSATTFVKAYASRIPFITFFSGLDVYINRTDQLYTSLEVDGQPVIMSRADFWALAGIEAVYYSNELATSCRGCVQHPPAIT